MATPRIAKALGISDLDWRNVEVKDGRKMVVRRAVSRKVTSKAANVAGIRVFRTAEQTALLSQNVRNIHFVDCDLQDVTFWYGCIENCIFERCNIKHMALMATKVNDCVLSECDGRGMVFGGYGLLGHRSSNFRRCSFHKCDFRETYHSTESYYLCDFSDCNLSGVEYHGAVFEDCKFSGKVHDVWFRQRDREGQRRQNYMSRCDFRDADVRRVYFSNIDLNPAMFTSNEDMIWICKPEVWVRWGATLSKEANPGADRFIAEVIRESGTPSLTYRSLFRHSSAEDVERLIQIAQEAACFNSVVSS